ncbi:MAG: response regulator [Blastocatellia bacterium]|nr:response regulator [Blastocatellia bacterium]
METPPPSQTRFLTPFHYSIGILGWLTLITAAVLWSQEAVNLHPFLFVFILLDIVMYDPLFQVNIGVTRSQNLYVALSIAIRFAVLLIFGPLPAMLCSSLSVVAIRVQHILRTEQRHDSLPMNLGRVLFGSGKESLLWFFVGLTAHAFRLEPVIQPGAELTPLWQTLVFFVVNQVVLHTIYTFKEYFDGNELLHFIKVYSTRVFAFEGITVPIGWLIAVVFHSPKGGLFGTCLFGGLLLSASWLIKKFYVSQETLTERVKELSAINRVGHVVNATNQLDHLIHAIVTELDELIPSDCMSLATYNAETKSFTCRYLREGDETFPEFDQPADVGITGFLSRSQNTLRISSREELDQLPISYTVVGNNKIPQALLGVPLWQGNELQGTVLLQRYSGVPFSDAQTQLLTTLASTLATALYNVRLFENLQQSFQEIRLANQLKSEFLNNVSHELRTPLTTIMGWAQILQARSSNLDRQAQTGIEQINRSSETLMILINDLLDLSRLDQGTLEITPQTTDINRLIAQTVQSVTLSAGNKRIRVETDLGKPLPYLPVDPNRMKQVLWNLLTNAVKFTPHEGTIRVSSRFETNQVVIKVSDTGVGISPKALPYIFDRFRQADGSSTRQFGGTGIGLTIVKALIDLHGGKVTCESVLGTGTTFTVELRVPTKQLRFVSAELEKPTVLIIERNEELREITSAMVEAAGYQVVGAPDTVSALAQAEQTAPGIILLDVSQSSVEGVAELEALKNAPATSQAKVIALTTSFDETDQTFLLTKGFSCCLAKPFRSKELLGALAACLS